MCQEGLFGAGFVALFLAGALFCIFIACFFSFAVLIGCLAVSLSFGTFFFAIAFFCAVFAVFAILAIFAILAVFGRALCGAGFLGALCGSCHCE